MAIKVPVNIIFGAGNVGDSSRDPMARFDTPEQVTAILDAFHARAATSSGRRPTLDASEVYSPNAPGTCHPHLGAANPGDRFDIDTKLKSGAPGDHTAEKIASRLDSTLKDLRVSKLHAWYFHGPDRDTPLEEQIAAMDKEYRAGKFEHFGLSNYPAKEVAEILELCEKKGYVKPTLFQGQYNAIVRGAEKELFPLLRKHGIPFNAYGAAAAGFFNGNYKNAKPGTRFDTSHPFGVRYSGRYLKPNIQAAVDDVREKAAKHGINGHAMALRWEAYHSQLSGKHGDSIILGASSVDQLNGNLDTLEEGPLPEEVVEAMNGIYGKLGEDEPPHHW